MSRPITWQTVRGGDNAAALNLIRQSQQDLANAVQGVGGALQQGVDRYVGNQTDQFLHALNQAPDQATRDQMIAAAKTAFLDTGRVNAANRAIISDERGAQIFNNEMQRFANQQQMHNFNVQDRQQQQDFNNILMNSFNTPTNSPDALSKFSAAKIRGMATGKMTPQQMALLDQGIEQSIMQANPNDYISESFSKELDSLLSTLPPLSTITNKDITKVNTEVAKEIGKKYPNLDVQTQKRLANQVLQTKYPTYSSFVNQATANEARIAINEQASQAAFNEVSQRANMFAQQPDKQRAFIIDRMKETGRFNDLDNLAIAEDVKGMMDWVENDFKDLSSEQKYHIYESLINESQSIDTFLSEPRARILTNNDSFSLRNLPSSAKNKAEALNILKRALSTRKDSEATSINNILDRLAKRYNK